MPHWIDFDMRYNSPVGIIAILIGVDLMAVGIGGEVGVAEA